jgi:hypothetical protein
MAMATTNPASIRAHFPHGLVFKSKSPGGFMLFSCRDKLGITITLHP